ncbi:unnamed protein product [Closterium sp. NIES-64]|nr:unnamed protein product [Closterium sp. NIES-64]
MLCSPCVQVADIVPDMPAEWREAAAGAANGVAKGSRDRNGAGEARVMGFDLTAASKEALTPAAPAASAASSSSSSEGAPQPWADQQHISCRRTSVACGTGPMRCLSSTPSMLPLSSCLPAPFTAPPPPPPPHCPSDRPRTAAHKWHVGLGRCAASHPRLPCFPSPLVSPRPSLPPPPRTVLLTDLVLPRINLLPPRISGMWDWADALPLIHAFHAANGYGEAAVSSGSHQQCQSARRVASWQQHRTFEVLEWKGGRFVAAAPDLVTPPPSPLFSIYNHHREALRGLVHTHVDSRPSPHVLLHGPPGTGKSTLLRSVLLPMALPSSALLSIPSSDSPLTSPLAGESGEGSSRGRRELRVVLLQKGEVKGIAGVLQAAAKMPSLRFCLLIDNLNLRVSTVLFSSIGEIVVGWSAVKGIAGVLQAAAKMPSLRVCLVIDNLNLRERRRSLLCAKSSTLPL